MERLGPLLASLGDLPEGEQPSHPEERPLPEARLYVTGCASSFADGALRWLGRRPAVQQVDLRSAGCAF